MMINYKNLKSHDEVLLGKNCFSLLFGIELLKSKKKTLIIDSPNWSYGHYYSKTFNSLEKCFFEYWYNSHFKDPSSGQAVLFLETETINSVSNLRIKKGARPSENLREMCRKFPYLFKPKGLDDKIFFDRVWQDQFDKSFFSICERLARVFFFFKETDNFSIKDFLSHYPEEISLGLHTFMTRVSLLFKSAQEGDIKTLESREFKLLQLEKYCSHKSFKPSLNSREIFFLYLSFLSPVYFLDEEGIQPDLEKFFVEMGGRCHKTNLSEIQVTGKSIEALGLGNYLGNIFPDQVKIFSSELGVGALRPAERTYPYFQGMNLRMKSSFSEDLFSKTFLGPQLLNYIDPSECGVWRFFYHPSKDENSIWVQAGTQVYGQGLSTTFCQNTLHAELQEVLAHLGAKNLQSEIKMDSIRWEVSADFYLILDKNDHAIVSKNRNRRRSIDFYHSPLSSAGLKNLTHFGPLLAGEQGLLSHMIDMRENLQSRF